LSEQLQRNDFFVQPQGSFINAGVSTSNLLFQFWQNLNGRPPLPVFSPATYRIIIKQNPANHYTPINGHFTPILHAVAKEYRILLVKYKDDNKTNTAGYSYTCFFFRRCLCFHRQLIVL